jgi:hypothetical protein
LAHEALLLLALAAAACPPALRAQAAPELRPAARLPHQGAAQLAISGDTLAFATRTPFESSQVWVYRRLGADWRLETVLAPPRETRNLVFGASLALSGDTLVVGAPPEEALVYVRQRASGWALQQELPAPESYTSPDFGATVAISGDILLVGGPSQLPDQTAGGVAYAYRLAGGVWHRSGLFFHPNDNFFSSLIALDGPLAAIGDAGGLDTFLLGDHGWIAQGPIPLAAEATLTSAALSGYTQAAGMTQNGVAVWQLAAGAWTQQTTLPAVAAPVALQGGTLAAFAFDGTPQIYQRQGRHGAWLLTATLAEPISDPGINSDIAVSGGGVVASSTGPVFVFDVD